MTASTNPDLAGDPPGDSSAVEPATEAYRQTARSGVLPAAVWVAAGGVITAVLLVVLVVGSTGGWNVQESEAMPLATQEIVTLTLPALVQTPEEQATATATPTLPPPTVTPQPTSPPATPTPTATHTPTPTDTPPPALLPPTEMPTGTPTPMSCPGNQIWNGTECICPPNTVWVAKDQWCVEVSKP